MIKFNLRCCNCEYNFEGLFESSNEYSKQKKNKLINCPNCESFNIKKGLMAPNLTKKSNTKIDTKKRTLASNISKLKKMVEKNFEYVGSNFLDEAKKMKYGEVKERSIYGEATLEQTKELIEEEIEVIPLPFSSKKSN